MTGKGRSGSDNMLQLREVGVAGVVSSGLHSCACSDTRAACLQWFNAVDRDGSGQISAKELQRALALGNLRFSLSVTAQMIRWE